MRSRAAQMLRPATWKPLHFPAPVGGLNTISPASEMPETDCPVSWNLIGAENGVRGRLGSVEWVTGLTGLGDNTVRSEMAYTGGFQDGTKDRLFCATSTGIWDVTASTAAPGPKKITFGVQTGDAGYGTWWVTTTAADRYLIYLDEANGYFIYTESTDLWAQVTQGAGAGQINAPAVPANYVAGTLFKNRNWFVRKNSTIADYLAAGAVFGATTAFDFGSKFKAGGILVGLFNWAYDGGQGMDNLLVAVSSAGDIVIYEGTDPASAATFGLRGVWFGGGVPYGRRFATDFGGDMLVATSFGIIPLSKLVIGNPILDRTLYSTYKIGNLFTQLVEQYGGLKGWSLRFHPNDSALIVTVPSADGQPTNQLVMSLTTKGWSKYRNLPMISAEAWKRQLYFGTHDGRIMKSTGYVDNVLLSDPTGNTFTPVDWSLVTRSAAGVAQKIAHQIRTTILSGDAAPLVNAEVRFGYDTSEAAVPPATAVKAAVALWGTAKWDVDAWAGDLNATKRIFGAQGRGPEVAVAVRGLAGNRTVLVGADVMHTEGGFF